MVWWLALSARAADSLISPPVAIPAIPVGIGDIDADGFDDLIVGDELWFGAPLLLDPATVRRQQGLPAPFVPSPTIDFDADGYGDAMSYVQHGNGFGGALTVWYGGAAGIDASRSVNWPATFGDQEYLGVLRCAADFDLDGDADLIFGRMDTAANDLVTLEVHPGGPGELDPSPSLTFDVLDISDWSRIRLLCGEDPNGDGYPDVVVTDASGDKDDIYLYAGGPGGLATAADRFAPTVTLHSDAETVGDLDADGYDDLVVWGEDGSFGQYVVYGGPGGFKRSQFLPELYPDNVDAVGDGADLDGDGDADLIIGLPATSGNGLGKVVVHHGDPAGLSTAPDEEYASNAAWFGSSPRIVGDLNGDGRPEVQTNNQSNAAWVFYGDVDADGDNMPSVYDCDDGDASVLGADALWPDYDRDGWGIEIPGQEIRGCSADGYAADVGDCHDGDASVHPEAVELPGDGVDQDCDELELCYSDADGDGARTDTTSAVPDPACDGEGQAAAGAPLDCDDADPTRADDCSEPVDTDVPEETDGPKATPDDEKGGCDTGGAGPGWLALALLPLLRRRR